MFSKSEVAEMVKVVSDSELPKGKAQVRASDDSTIYTRKEAVGVRPDATRSW